MKQGIMILRTPAPALPEAALLPAMAAQRLSPAETPPPPRRKGSAAGHAILHEPGVHLPGVERARKR